MPLTPQEQKQLKDGITKDARRFWEQSGDAATTNEERSSFVAGPAPSSPLRRIGWEAARQACRRWAAGRGPAIAPWRDLYTRDVCEPYIEDEFGPLGDGTAAPPFTGGQCVGLNYRAVGTIFWDILICSTGTVVPVSEVVSTELIFIGPVISITPRYFNPGACGPRDFIFDVVHNGGATTSGAFFKTNATNRAFNARFSGAFEAADGGDGGCGDPPDEWTPGTGPTIPPETGPIPDPPGWPIPDFDIDISIDPDGTINIDFGDGEPPETIDPGQPAPTPIAPGPEPGNQGNPGAGGEAGEEDAEGEAPEGSVLVGVRLQLTEAPSNAKRFVPAVYRGAAYIYMGGDVGLDQDFAGSMLIADQFIFAEKDNLTRWRVSANSGFRWFVTPYYREAS